LRTLSCWYHNNINMIQCQIFFILVVQKTSCFSQSPNNSSVQQRMAGRVRPKFFEDKKLRPSANVIRNGWQICRMPVRK